MEVRRLHQNAWEISDFLSKDEVKSFFDYIENSPEDRWYADMATGHWAGRSLLLRGQGDKKIEDTTDLIQERLFASFSNYTRIHQLNSILRALPGQGMGPHRDDIELEDKVNMYGVVVYLNDDYYGGEIYYPEYGVAHKPRARSMVVHRANVTHGVTPVVGDGVRYVITSFVKGDKHTMLEGEY